MYFGRHNFSNELSVSEGFNVIVLESTCFLFFRCNLIFTKIVVVFTLLPENIVILNWHLIHRKFENHILLKD